MMRLQKYCAPDGYVRGVVNFASPIPLFYSDLADPNYENQFFIINICSNTFWKTGFIFLTV